MNGNPKEKSHRLYVRVSKKEKELIDSHAKACGLSTAEYLRKRALGYSPRAVQPDVFFDLYSELCDLYNSGGGISEQSEAALLDLIDRIHSELLLPGKEKLSKWQPPDSGL